jgi:hypothetical protein
MSRMVEPTQRHEIGQVGSSPVDPVPDVMAVGARRRDRASRKPAAFVATLQGQPQSRGDQPVDAANVDRQPVALGDGHDVGVTAEPAHRRRGKPGAVLDAGAATGRLAPEHCFVDVHNYLCGWCDGRRLCGSGDPRLAQTDERIRAQHRMGFVLGGELELIRGGNLALLGGDDVRHGFDRGHDEGTFFLGEHSHQLEHAVVAPPEPQTSIEKGVTSSTRIVGLQRASNTSADPGQLSPGRLERDLQPQLVIRRRGHLGDRANLVEGKPPVSKGRMERGQCPERMARPNHLTADPHVDPDVDREPVCAGAHPHTPPGAIVIKLRAQVDEFRRRSVDAGRQQTDALLESYSSAVLHRHIIANICSSRTPGSALLLSRGSEVRWWKSRGMRAGARPIRPLSQHDERRSRDDRH